MRPRRSLGAKLTFEYFNGDLVSSIETGQHPSESTLSDLNAECNLASIHFPLVAGCRCQDVELVMTGVGRDARLTVHGTTIAQQVERTLTNRNELSFQTRKPKQIEKAKYSIV